MKTDLMQPESRCIARRKNGTPCRNWAIRGGNVCRMHGGGAPAVRQKARERLLAAADMAAAQLIKFIKDERVPYAVRFQAIRDLLDRADLGGKTAMEFSVTKFEAMLTRVIVDDDEVDDEPNPQIEAWQREAIEGAVVASRMHDLSADDDVAELEQDDAAEVEVSVPPALPPCPPVQAASLADVPPKRVLDGMSPAERRAAVRSSVQDGSPTPRASRPAKLRGRAR